MRRPRYRWTQLRRLRHGMRRYLLGGQVPRHARVASGEPVGTRRGLRPCVLDGPLALDVRRGGAEPTARRGDGRDARRRAGRALRGRGGFDQRLLDEPRPRRRHLDEDAPRRRYPRDACLCAEQPRGPRRRRHERLLGRQRQRHERGPDEGPPRWRGGDDARVRAGSDPLPGSRWARQASPLDWLHRRERTTETGS